jgi:hypothetical protein
LLESESEFVNVPNTDDWAVNEPEFAELAGFAAK